MPRKTKLAVCTALDKAIARINSYSYRVARICSDDEAVLLSTTDHLGSRGIRISSTPADTHEHRVERKIQSVKSRRRALLCSLSYVLPRELEMESYLAAIHAVYLVPNTVTGSHHNPGQVFSRERIYIPQFYFGCIGNAFTPIRNPNEMRAEPAIFIANGSSIGYNKVYLPHTKEFYSRAKFIPYPPQVTIPPSWNIQRRLSQPMAPTLIPHLFQHLSHSVTRDNSALQPHLPTDMSSHSTIEEGVPASNRLTQEGALLQHGHMASNSTNQEGEVPQHEEGAIQLSVQQVPVTPIPEVILANPSIPSDFPTAQEATLPPLSRAPVSNMVPPQSAVSIHRHPRQAHQHSWKDGPLNAKYVECLNTSIRQKLKSVDRRDSILE